MPTLTLTMNIYVTTLYRNMQKIKIPKTSRTSDYTRKITMHASLPTAI